RGAQQVHPGVALAHHGGGGDRVLRGPAGFRDAGDLGDASPEGARRTEFRDGGELVVGGGEAELDLVQRVGDLDTGGGERAQVGQARGDGGAEFLGVGGAG